MQVLLTALLLPTILMLAGLYFAVRNFRFLKNPHALHEYMRKSPSAHRWVEKYGIEAATKMAKDSFVPFGIVLSSLAFLFGAWNLVRVLISLW
jgi:hypothetical protein